MEILKDIQFDSFPSRLVLATLEETSAAQGDLFVADDNTAGFLSPEQREKAVILPAGESEKTFASIERILARAVELKLDRSSLFVGLGGGVICDMTAFAASLYMRGTRVELMPTTLLAMVDAAVGGKTGVDYGSYKNMIGTFYPARQVWICPDYVKSLPDREYLCGLAEVIKTAILGDEALLIMLEEKREALLARDPILVREMIVHCVRFKAKVVEEDLRESGVRASLNLGHTFGHALESITGFSGVSHGEGVAWGMSKAVLAARLRGDISEAAYRRQITLLTDFGYPLDYPFSVDELIEAMGHDKKIQGGQKRFVLPAEGGKRFQILPLDETFLRKVLE
ncbi:MAG: 3-dehydroquinate synthase [Spirochaetales bacterium]|nr:3-dehydroquinate synthase [Spirochaetales bacterium]